MFIHVIFSIFISQYWYHGINRNSSEQNMLSELAKLEISRKITKWNEGKWEQSFDLTELGCCLFVFNYGPHLSAKTVSTLYSVQVLCMALRN